MVLFNHTASASVHATPLPLPPRSLADLYKFVDLTDINLYLCMFFVVASPLFHNLVCRYEYKTKQFSRLFGSPTVACVALSPIQLIPAQFRHYFFMRCLASQPVFTTAVDKELEYLAIALLISGTIFVVTSVYQLGYTGTFHGDHFGLLLPEKVTGFPFNVLDHPMYEGGMINFLGAAIGHRSITGILLTLWVQIVYNITEAFEGPFTEMIYSQKDANKKKE